MEWKNLFTKTPVTSLDRITQQKPPENLGINARSAWQNTNDPDIREGIVDCAKEATQRNTVGFKDALNRLNANLKEKNISFTSGNPLVLTGEDFGWGS
jgi:hypothetical protein